MFARELGFPRHPDRGLEVLNEGKTTSIDLGRAEYTVAGEPRQRFFVQLAGAGLDSRAIELVDWELKKKLGALAYVVAGCKALSEPQPVIVAQGSNSVSGELVLIGNGRFYGGSLAVFPAASLQDGLLSVCILPKVTLPRLLAALPGILTGRWYKLLFGFAFQPAFSDIDQHEPGHFAIGRRERLRTAGQTFGPAQGVAGHRAIKFV